MLSAHHHTLIKTTTVTPSFKHKPVLSYRHTEQSTELNTRRTFQNWQLQALVGITLWFPLNLRWKQVMQLRFLLPSKWDFSSVGGVCLCCGVRLCVWQLSLQIRRAQRYLWMFLTRGCWRPASNSRRNKGKEQWMSGGCLMMEVSLDPRNGSECGRSDERNHNYLLYPVAEI